jgi:hypothetical protein
MVRKKKIFFLFFVLFFLLFAVSTKKLVRGIGRLRHVKSLDNMQQRNFRPGSKLEVTESTDLPTIAKKTAKRPFRILSIDGGENKNSTRLNRLISMLSFRFRRFVFFLFLFYNVGEDQNKNIAV